MAFDPLRSGAFHPFAQPTQQSDRCARKRSLHGAAAPSSLEPFRTHSYTLPAPNGCGRRSRGPDRYVRMAYRPDARADHLLQCRHDDHARSDARWLRHLAYTRIDALLRRDISHRRTPRTSRRRSLFRRRARRQASFRRRYSQSARARARYGFQRPIVARRPHGRDDAGRRRRIIAARRRQQSDPVAPRPARHLRYAGRTTRNQGGPRRRSSGPELRYHHTRRRSAPANRRPHRGALRRKTASDRRRCTRCQLQFQFSERHPDRRRDRIVTIHLRHTFRNPAVCPDSD